MRTTAQSIDEICARYSCKQQTRETFINAASDKMVVVVLDMASLASAIPILRGGYEIVEIYVRPDSADAVFEPLDANHFMVDGQVAAIVRRRVGNEFRMVGIMLAKDEADVIPDVIANLKPNLDALYYFAGDEATQAAIVEHAPPGWARNVVIPPDLPHTDGLRHFLLEQARTDALTDGDFHTWVMSVQGDEIYDDNLRQHVLRAQRERATVMTCQVATFLLHDSQRDGWDWTLPLEKRLTHYIWDFGEHAGFLDFPWIYYTPSEHMRAHPHGLYPAKYASARPVRKHYPFRTPDQTLVRIRDRIKSGWQPHYQNYLTLFAYDKAADRDVKRYFGWFPEAERVEGIW